MQIFFLSSFFFVYFGAVAVFIVFLPKILISLGYTPFEIGVIFALPALMKFITPFFFLKHFKLNNKTFYFSSILAVLMTFCFYFIMDSFFLFALVSTILGITMAVVLPYVDTTAMEILKKERYGKSRLYGSVGFILVSLFLGKYLDGPVIAIHLYLALIILIGVFGYLIVKDNTQEYDKEIKTNFSLKTNLSFWITIFLMQVSFGPFYNFFTIYEESHGISLEVISYLWTVGVLFEIAMLYFQGSFFKRFSLVFLLKFSLVLTTLRWLLVYLFPENLPILYFSQTLHAFSFALFHSASIAYLYELYKGDKLVVSFFYAFSFGLGGFLGSILSGTFYSEDIFLYAAVISLIAFFTFRVKSSEKSI